MVAINETREARKQAPYKINILLPNLFQADASVVRHRSWESSTSVPFDSIL